MVERYRSTVETSNYFPAIIGDLDKDGNAEIVIAKADPATHGNYSVIYILNHQAQLKHTITLPTGVQLTTAQCPIICDLNNDGYGEIIIPANIGKKLLVYSHTANLLASIDVPSGFHRTVGVADFNKDGIPEIYTGTSIYQYSGGSITQIIAGTSNLNTVAQDINGDGVPELVGANRAYKVDYSAKTVTPIGTAVAGVAVTRMFALADIDLDGDIEVVTLVPDSGAGANKKISVIVWDPKTGTTKYPIHYTNEIEVSTGKLMDNSWPFIGDTDGNHYPDIVFMGGSNEKPLTYVYRMEFDKTEGKLVTRKQDNSFQDFSSRCTSMSMFDFNNDGANEIIYRDEICLYILDGGNTAGAGGNDYFFKRHKTITKNNSGTGWEYPVVASLTSTGESYVIMNSGTSTDAGYHFSKGTLRIYGADEAGGYNPWAMSRPVWNQFAFYQNTIDNDLKIIAHPLPLNYKMISGDGTNQLYPFNGHMMQRGIINENTLEFFTPIADLVVTSVKYDLNTVTDKMTVRVTVANEGDAGIDPPIPVKVYKTVASVRSLQKTQNITTAMPVGNSIVVSIVIDNYSTLGNVEKLDVEVEIPTGQYDCKPNNNAGFEIPKIKAVADERVTNVNQSITIPVIDNDILGDCTTSNIAVSLDGTPTKGSATLSGKQVVYTPQTDNIGGASFNYKITCDGNTSTAKVSIGTSSLVRAEFIKHAAEPNIAGEIKLRFSDNTTTSCDYPVKITYTVTDPPGLTFGTDYTVSPASPATITAGQNSVTLQIIPKNNQIVESTRGLIEIEITGVNMITP